MLTAVLLALIVAVAIVVIVHGYPSPSLVDSIARIVEAFLSPADAIINIIPLVLAIVLICI